MDAHLMPLRFLADNSKPIRALIYLLLLSLKPLNQRLEGEYITR